LLLYRQLESPAPHEVLLVHPGGPFWARKDLGSWSVPKGEYDGDEDPLAVARREFDEEIGLGVPAGDPVLLGELKQPSGKVVTVFALHADLSLDGTHSNTFELEWPKGSGRIQEFPEVDRAEWFGLDEARHRLTKGQVGFIDQLEALLAG
jgi:predicted NUDIX family NTP pyrophosphohydrolase